VSDADPLLSLEAVHAGYGLTRVLTGVDVAVDRGSIVSLVGRNGVGKTTTLRAIVGDVIPTRGTVSFDGLDVTTLETESTIRKGITFVPEDRRIFPGLTVRENVEMGRLGGASSDGPSVDDVLDTFENLREREDRLGSHLSGGEQQMLAIARALVADPDLMLLDEPFEGLAPFIVRRLEDIIADINEQRDIAVLLVEQNVAAAVAIADRHYILDEGRIAETVTTAELRENEAMRQRYLGV
jgi:branched-chain amino acid transport system ATP-binding protein